MPPSYLKRQALRKNARAANTADKDEDESAGTAVYVNNFVFVANAEMPVLPVLSVEKQLNLQYIFYK